MSAPRSNVPPALLLAGLAACSGCGTEGSRSTGEAGERPNVVLVVVDTLRRDHLGCYGYGRDTSPNIDRFAASAVRYDFAVAQAPWTTPSIGALFASQYPSTLGILTERSALADDLVLLSEVLDDAGYETGAVVSHSFCSSDWGFAQGFDTFDDTNVQGHAAVTSAGVTDRALAFLEEAGPGPDPFFLWVHYFDPHCAYVEHEPFPFGGAAGYEGPVRSGQLFRRLQKLKDELGPRDVEELRRLYDSEIAFTDRELGRLFDALEGMGLADDTLVVLTADHGEEFLEHGRLGHAKTLYEELIAVPLLVRYPGTPPGVEPDPVALIDVYPTILDVLELAGPDDLAGVPIAPGSPHLDPARVVFSETARLGGMRAAVTRGHKLVQADRGRSEELFSLADDPGEERPVAGDGAVRAQLAEALERFREIQARGRVAPEVALDADELRHLDELGYAGDDDEDGP